MDDPDRTTEVGRRPLLAELASLHRRRRVTGSVRVTVTTAETLEQVEAERLVAEPRPPPGCHGAGAERARGADPAGQGCVDPHDGGAGGGAGGGAKRLRVGQQSLPATAWRNSSRLRARSR